MSKPSRLEMGGALWGKIQQQQSTNLPQALAPPGINPTMLAQHTRIKAYVGSFPHPQQSRHQQAPPAQPVVAQDDDVQMADPDDANDNDVITGGCYNSDIVGDDDEEMSKTPSLSERSMEARLAASISPSASPEVALLACHLCENMQYEKHRTVSERCYHRLPSSTSRSAIGLGSASCCVVGTNSAIKRPVIVTPLSSPGPSLPRRRASLNVHRNTVGQRRSDYSSQLIKSPWRGLLEQHKWQEEKRRLRLHLANQVGWVSIPVPVPTPTMTRTPAQPMTAILAKTQATVRSAAPVEQQQPDVSLKMQQQQHQSVARSYHDGVTKRVIAMQQQQDRIHAKQKQNQDVAEHEDLRLRQEREAQDKMAESDQQNDLEDHEQYDEGNTDRWDDLDYKQWTKKESQKYDRAQRPAEDAYWIKEENNEQEQIIKEYLRRMEREQRQQTESENRRRLEAPDNAIDNHSDDGFADEPEQMVVEEGWAEGAHRQAPEDALCNMLRTTDMVREPVSKSKKPASKAEPNKHDDAHEDDLCGNLRTSDIIQGPSSECRKPAPMVDSSKRG